MIQRKRDVDRLWAEYQERKSDQARNDLIVAYMPLVKRVAKTIGFTLPPSVEVNDLISYGVFGLIDAIEKFDPSRGFKFETYATSRIRGSILDELRAIDWVPRSMRSRARSIDAIQGSSQYGRHLSDREVAAELGYTDAQYNQIQADLNMASLLHLETTLDSGSESRTRSSDESVTLADMIPDVDGSPEDIYDIEDIRMSVAQAVEALPERERMVLTLYYYDGLTLAEIGHILGVTESRVCQIHTKACRTMSTNTHLL